MKNEEKLDSRVTVELLGKTRLIRYPIKSAIQYKRLTGGGSLLKTVDLGDPEKLCAFFWAGLIADDASLNGIIDDNGKPSSNIQEFIDQLYELDYATMIELFPLFYAALSRSQPESEKGEEQKKGKSQKKSGTS